MLRPLCHRATVKAIHVWQISDQQTNRGFRFGFRISVWVLGLGLRVKGWVDRSRNKHPDLIALILRLCLRNAG